MITAALFIAVQDRKQLKCTWRYITICETDDQSKFDAWNRAFKAGVLDNLEGWDGEGYGRGVQDVHVYTHGWFMSMYGKNHHNIVKQFAAN